VQRMKKIFRSIYLNYFILLLVLVYIINILNNLNYYKCIYYKKIEYELNNKINLKLIREIKGESLKKKNIF